MQKVLFAFALLVGLSGCAGVYYGGCYPAPAPGPGGGLPPVTVPAQVHYCTHQSGDKEPCYAWLVVGGNGTTRNGETITFHMGGRFWHADGINDATWRYLMSGGSLEVRAYHF